MDLQEQDVRAVRRAIRRRIGTHGQKPFAVICQGAQLREAVKSFDGKLMKWEGVRYQIKIVAWYPRFAVVRAEPQMEDRA